MADPVPEKPTVSILVVAYNSASVIEACLGSIPSACTQHPYEVLLVDNGDGTSEALVAARFPQVRIVPSRGNVGFAAGNNLLAEQARGRFLLLANPDLEMRAGAVDALLAGAERYPQAAAWGGVTLDRDGQPDIGNTVHIPSLREMASRLMGRSRMRIDRGDLLAHDRQVEALSGGFVMFSHKAWQEAGGLDARYFLYCEEVDLFYRLAQRGHTFWRIASARAFHDTGHGNDFSPMRLTYRAAGTMEFVRLHWPRWRQILAFWLIWQSALLRYAAGAVAGRWRPRWRKVGEGYRLIALAPSHWRFGYHPTRGLLARLGNSNE